MIEEGATHLGVATDHVIESFRNALWPGYKTGEGIEPALFAQFRSEEHTSELQSRLHLVCRLLLEKKSERWIGAPSRARPATAQGRRPPGRASRPPSRT